MTTSNFIKSAVFVSKKANQDQILTEVYEHLLKLGYVKGDFLEHVVKREHKFPTGLDTSTLGPNLPNIAIPHTEGQFVNKRLIVPVALKRSAYFGNMVKPNEKLQVKFLFVLLETNPDGQAKLLSQIMDFLAQTPVDKLRDFLHLQDPAAIYQFLIQHS